VTRSLTRRRVFAKVFAVPVMLAALIAVGLASGVLGDGIWDVISWIALGAPLAVIGLYALK
jgi:hypothetical protein